MRPHRERRGLLNALKKSIAAMRTKLRVTPVCFGSTLIFIRSRVIGGEGVAAPDRSVRSRPVPTAR